MTKKPEPNEPRLLDRVRTEIRLRGMSYRTENSYVDWIRRFIIFQGKRHPLEMGPAEIRDFLAWLVNECNVAASKQNQALHSILFLYIELEVNQITVRGGKEGTILWQNIRERVNDRLNLSGQDYVWYRSINRVEMLPELKSGSLRILRCIGMVVLIPSTTMASRARRMRAIARSRVRL